MAGRGFPVGSDLRVIQGRWDFAELYDWYRYIGGRIRDEPSFSFSDVQEARNRLEYGVIDGAGRLRVEQRLRDAGIPCWLVSIEIRGRVSTLLP
jgi:hypothetical protein